MARITSTRGKGSARFGPAPIRVVARWRPEDIAKVYKAVMDRLNLDETCALLPDRTRDSVKDQYYRARADSNEPPLNSRQKNKRLEPEFSDIRFQKDAIEGSAKLLQALIDAGYVPAMKKVG